MLEEPGARGLGRVPRVSFPLHLRRRTITLCPTFKLWNENMVTASAKLGVRLDAILSVPPILEERGFVNVGTAGTKWALGSWPKGKREKRVGELLERVSPSFVCLVLWWCGGEK